MARKRSEPSEEDLKLKNELFAKLEPLISKTCIVTSNTSGMSIAGMTEGRSDDFKSRFLVTHFFNPVRYMKLLEIPHDKLNLNGGAIAMGHPLGATGSMILGTLVDELHRRQLRYGLATLCVGGGMGIATIVERI